jgi:trigger factor
MQSQVSEISPVLVEVKIEVPWSHVEKHLDAEFKKVGRTARVRGFRPGKAPMGVIKKVYGPQVEAEVASQLIQEGINHAVDEHEIRLVARPELEDFSKLTSGETFSFRAKMEVRPKIEKVDVDGIEIYRDREEITDAQIDAEIERLRVRHSDLEAPDPMRPAKDGDQLIVDYKITIDGEPADDLNAEESEANLGQHALLPELEAGLLGLSPGETKDIEVAFPDDHQNPRFRGKKIVFHTTVKELRERVLPDVDDDFAKDCGEFESLDALKADLRSKLEESATKRSEASIKDQLIQAVVDKNDIPVPPTMLEEQKRMMLYEVFQLSQMLGQPPDFDALMAQAEARAPRRVKAGLLLHALAKQENIEVGESDVEAKLAELAESTGKHIAKLRAEYRDEKRAQLENELLETRILGFLRDKAKIVDGKRPDPEPAGKTAESE